MGGVENEYLGIRTEGQTLRGVSVPHGDILPGNTQCPGKKHGGVSVNDA